MTTTNKNWTPVEELSCQEYEALTHIPVLLSTAEAKMIAHLSDKQAIELLANELFSIEEDAIFDLTTGHIENDQGQKVFYPPILYQAV